MTASPAEQLASAVLEQLGDEASDEEIEESIRQVLAELDGELIKSWPFHARPEQIAPGLPGSPLTSTDWRWWAVVTGRGWGKTRTAAEWVLDRSEQFAQRRSDHRVAACAPTVADARDVMVHGVSGLLACAARRGYQAHWQPGLRLVEVPELRTRITLFTAERPDQPRGPEHNTAWLEEFAAWPAKVDAHGSTAFSNLDFGLRLQCPDTLQPQGVVTTTPKPVPALRSLLSEEALKLGQVIRTSGSLYENLRNLAPSFVEAVRARYENTRLGEQEIHGILLDAVEGALWTPQMIDEHRVPAAQRDEVLSKLDTIVVGVDPPGGGSAECGIVVVGANTAESVAYTLDDRSVIGDPEVWGAEVAAAYREWRAQRVVVESNYGGDMTRSTIHVADPAVYIKKVVAKQNKQLRAEPVAALAARGRARHLGVFPDLESQQVTWTPGDDSPDRLDAYVHAVTDLLGLLTAMPSSAASPNTLGRRTPAAGRTPPGPGRRPPPTGTVARRHL